MRILFPSLVLITSALWFSTYLVLSASSTIQEPLAQVNQTPVSCAAVRVLPSTYGGQSSPIILANNTPNDGPENVTIPGIQTANARIEVEAVGNVFFNVSPVFLITGTTNLAPTITTFSPPNGSAGTSVTINGTNFIRPSAVRFNGLDANFRLNSKSQIVATAPAGDTAGPITVVTAAGAAISPVSFGGASNYSRSRQIAGAANNPLAGVTMSFDLNFQGTLGKTNVVTDSGGNYSSGNVGCQNNVTVTPFKPGFSFSPPSLTFVSSSCLSGTETANFTATQAGPNTVSFSQATFDTNEAATNLAITITRTGDTSGSAVVDFKTTDTDNFTVGCSDTINNMGSAFARCDYALTTETIVFNPGETTKTLLIPVINDSFAEGVETFSGVLSNVAGATLGEPSTALLRISDNETTTGPNPIFTTPFFVRQHYLDFLSREPEADEPWSAVLNNCSDVNNNPACDRLKVSGSFFGSTEFQLKGYFVYRFYKLAFDRLPLYTEIVTDMRAVTGQTSVDVFQKKGAFTNAFVLRTDFVAAFGGLTNDAYVMALMGRYSLNQITTPDPANPDGASKVALTSADLTNRLNGVGGTLTRAQVLRAIADSDQVFSLELNPAFVAMQYYGYLRRIPEQAGFNDWLNYLNTHPGEARTMVNGFMNSPEYRLRFGPNQ